MDDAGGRGTGALEALLREAVKAATGRSRELASR
jgi:hypothetical protein